MKPPIHDLSLVPGRVGNRTNRPGCETRAVAHCRRRRNANVAEADRQIAELVDRSTHELRLAWRQSYGTGPPLGLSRDLLIRALTNQLQEQSYGGMSRAVRRRLQSLSGASAKATMAVDESLAGLALRKQRIEFLLEPLLRGFTGVDRTANPCVPPWAAAG